MHFSVRGHYTKSRLVQGNFHNEFTNTGRKINTNNCSQSRSIIRCRLISVNINTQIFKENYKSEFSKNKNKKLRMKQNKRARRLPSSSPKLGMMGLVGTERYIQRG